MPIRTALDALAPLETAPPAPSDPPVEADLRPLRDRIDAIDRAVLFLLNERARCANVIGHVKKSLGLPVYVPSREAEVLRNVFDANPGPLPDATVRHLFERIIDETRALERQTYQHEPDAPIPRIGPSQDQGPPAPAP